jgi:hypothetical protein
MLFSLRAIAEADNSKNDKGLTSIEVRHLNQYIDSVSAKPKKKEVAKSEESEDSEDSGDSSDSEDSDITLNDISKNISELSNNVIQLQDSPEISNQKKLGDVSNFNNQALKLLAKTNKYFDLSSSTEMMEVLLKILSERMESMDVAIGEHPEVFRDVMKQTDALLKAASKILKPEAEVKVETGIVVTSSQDIEISEDSKVDDSDVFISEEDEDSEVDDSDVFISEEDEEDVEDEEDEEDEE